MKRVIFNQADIGKSFYHRLTNQEMILLSLKDEKVLDVDGIQTTGSTSAMFRISILDKNVGSDLLHAGEFYAFECLEEILSG